MSELLSKKEEAVAAKEGWCLALVYDSILCRWLLCTLPLTFTDKQGAQQALDFVLGQARLSNPLALKALRLLTAHNATKGKK